MDKLFLIHALGSGCLTIREESNALRNTILSPKWPTSLHPPQIDTDVVASHARTNTYAKKFWGTRTPPILMEHVLPWTIFSNRETVLGRQADMQATLHCRLTVQPHQKSREGKCIFLKQSSDMNEEHCFLKVAKC